jgi:arylformamidase
VEIIDVSVRVRPGMVTYPGDPPLRLERVSSISDGEVANLSRLDFGLHTGTHVDAPLHFVDGAADVDSLPLEVLVGPAIVVDATGVEGSLDARALAGLDLGDGVERVLFKTTNSELWATDSFAEDFVALAEDGARVLVERGVRLVGIDYLSIGGEGAHKVLLGAGVVAVEGLDLRGVEPGAYRLVCAPVRIVGAEGAPARAFLLR